MSLHPWGETIFAKMVPPSQVFIGSVSIHITQDSTLREELATRRGVMPVGRKHFENCFLPSPLFQKLF
ncbi:MAG: hypothetical protein Q4C70_04865, partial [Planctomycetia bacterium]|nr:hypothetical protein [Planctomycetia bacterium]